MKLLRGTCVVAGAVMSILVAPTAAVAAPPSNDALRNAIHITAPFRDSVDITDATRDTGAPIDRACFGKRGRSVWYRFSLARTQRIVLATNGSNYDTVLNLYRRTDSGRLRLVDCNNDREGPASALARRVEGGAKYVVMVADFDNDTTAARLRLRMVRPIQTEVSSNGQGQVLQNGSARLSGTVWCNRPGSLFVAFQIRQRVSDTAVADGFDFRRNIDCSQNRATWRLRVDPDGPADFVPGRARLTLESNWYVCERFADVGCDFEQFKRRTVQLVG
jgi:hypothetical protein